MAQSSVPDPDVLRRRWGLVAGVSIAVVAIVVAYVGLLLDQGGAMRWVLEWQWIFWVAPPVLAVLLGLFSRTRSLAAGLGLGLAVTWIVGVPTCVVVSLSTVPYL